MHDASCVSILYTTAYRSHIMLKRHQFVRMCLASQWKMSENVERGENLTLHVTELTIKSRYTKNENYTRTNKKKKKKMLKIVTKKLPSYGSNRLIK